MYLTLVQKFTMPPHTHAHARTHTPDTGLRVRLRRRKPARARVGDLARLQADCGTWRARQTLPGQMLPEAHTKLHLVSYLSTEHQLVDELSLLKTIKTVFPVSFAEIF